MASIDLNLLLVLHTVLAERNVARAAARLHVTPSAVSNALARLRDVLGDPLVTRKGRGIVPTPRAIELGPGIARAIAEIERALLAAPFDPASCKRTFTVAVSDLGQRLWAPRLALAMRRAMPLAVLRIVGIDALVSLGDLTSSEIDVHLGVASKASGLHVEPLCEEQSVLVARRAHPLFAVRGKKASRRSLGDLRHVRVEMVPCKNLRDPYAALFERAGVPRHIMMTVPSYAVAAEVVAASNLVTMLTTSFLAAKGRELGLRAIEASLPTRAIAITMSWHERTHADPAARAFRGIVREVVGDPSAPARSADSSASVLRVRTK